ncbi:uncharacterized protein ACIBXB_005926 [Morphnus guianensis]
MFKKGNLQRERRLEGERNTYADTKVREEGGGGGVPEEVMPLQPMVRWQAVPLQPMEVNDGADAHLQPVEDPTPEQSDAPKDGRDSMGKPVLEQSVTEDRPMERTHAREVREGLSPVGGTPRWSRGRVRSPPSEEEGEAETTCDELTPTPIPCPPALQVGGGLVENPGVKLCPGRREGWREGVLRFGFISHYPTLVDWQ